MKRERFRLLDCIIVVLLFLVTCEKTLAIEVEQLWSMQDIRDTGKLVESLGGLFIQRQVELRLKPPFYGGPMPLQYKTISKEMGGGIMGSRAIPLKFDFSSWHNLFIYKDSWSLATGIPAGAVAIDSKNQVILAESKVVKMLTANKQRTVLEIKEIHYDKDGRLPVFTSTFFVDFGDGFKTNEKNVMGKKKKEYFFIWPFGLSSP